MYGYKNVYESYYEHKCSATTEKDVIYQDIPGKGVRPRLKRWWHDLFLLSCSSVRSRHFYMSTYAMVAARAAHFRNNRGFIHPFSKFRNVWECLILHFLITHMILFNFNTSIIHTTPLFLHHLLAGIEYVFILDIFVSTRTGYAIRKTRQVVMNAPDILIHYLSTHAFIDVLCAIPLQNLKFLRHGNISDPSKNANFFVTTLNILSTLHMIRLFRVSRYWAKDRDIFWKTGAFKLLRIIVLGLVATMQVQALTTSLSVLHCALEGTSNARKDSYLDAMIAFKYARMEDEEAFFLFMMISRLFKSLFLFGYCLRPNTDTVDQLTAILTYCTAFIFHFWASGVVYNCVLMDNALDDTLSTTLDQTLTVLRHGKLPDKIHTKVKKYYDIKMSNVVAIEMRNRLYRALPRELKFEIKMFCCEGLVRNIPCFAELPAEIIAGIVELLYHEIYLEDDVLSSEWGQPEDLIVVEAGMVAVYSGQQELRHLEDGDHFGEHTVVSDDYVPSALLIAITPTGIQVVSKPALRNLMKRHPNKYLSDLERHVASKVTYDKVSSPFPDYTE